MCQKTIAIEVPKAYKKLFPGAAVAGLQKVNTVKLGQSSMEMITLAREAQGIDLIYFKKPWSTKDPIGTSFTCNYYSGIQR